jgi:hypothetical protein
MAKATTKTGTRAKTKTETKAAGPAKTDAKPKPKPKPRRPPKPTHCSYDFEIEDWEVNYAISVGDDPRFSRGPYSEHLRLELVARMIEPERFKDRRVHFTILGQREIDIAINTDDVRRGPAVHMGTLSMRGDRSDYLGVMPASAVWGLVPALEAGRIKVIHMTGTILHHGSSSIRWISFDRQFDEE